MVDVGHAVVVAAAFADPTYFHGVEMGWDSMIEVVVVASVDTCLDSWTDSESEKTDPPYSDAMQGAGWGAVDTFQGAMNLVLELGYVVAVIPLVRSDDRSCYQ